MTKREMILRARAFESCEKRARRESKYYEYWRPNHHAEVWQYSTEDQKRAWDDECQRGAYVAASLALEFQREARRLRRKAKP
jgi:hypothetical protein